MEEQSQHFQHLALRPRDREGRSKETVARGFQVPSPVKSVGEHSILPHPNHHLLQHHQTLRKRCPESLYLSSQLANNASRLRSPTESSIGSVPDSATTLSISSLASPLSSSYANDLQDFFSVTSSRPASRVLHRHQPSSGTCSTFVNDEDDGIIVEESPDFADKVRQYRPVTPNNLGANNDETLVVSPMTEAPINEQSVNAAAASSSTTPSSIHVEAPSSDPFAQRWDSSSTASDDCSEEDVDDILDYTLQLVYGVDLHDGTVNASQSRQAVKDFVRQLGQNIWQTPADTQSSNGHSSSSNSSLCTPGCTSGSGEANNINSRGGKRKKQASGRGDDDNGDDGSDNEGDNLLPIKRPRVMREDEALRLSCPYRKRNAHRFNVRDHHSCSMTYFPKFAELRQHIVKQHKRDDPSAFVCDRCNRDFPTRKELRDHQRLPRELMCEISDYDPESGIDGPTATKLLSRKRASGSSPEVQWREIWSILFPDDDDHRVQSYHFVPVIEHFELSASYMSAFSLLKTSLADKISNQATLETLATKFHQCFVETVQQCITNAQTKPYTNRSNKRNSGEQQAPQPSARNSVVPIARKPKDVLPRPDSGVVMDDGGSEESGSVMMSLNPRDSVRTIRSRGSQLMPREPEVMPTILQAGINEHHHHMIPHTGSTPPMSVSASAGTMDPAAVQAWSNGVLWDASFGGPSQFTAGGGMPDMAWADGMMHQMAMGNTVENGYPGFDHL